VNTAPSATSVPRAATLAYVAWILAWLVALGGLATDAWLSRALPMGLPAIGGSATAPNPLCVVVLDGLREQALWDEPTAMPWLRAFAEGGAGGVARAGDPTLTAACVRALLTGRKPDLKIALQNFAAPPVEGSWVQALRALGARAAHGGDAAIAQMCAPWLDPADVLAFLDRGPLDQGQCDAEAQPFVLERARAGYELLTLHLTGPDHAGHKHGALGEPYRAACARADAQLRDVVTAFLERHPAGTVLVAADHGVSAAGTHGGGEPAARRAPFVLRGPGVARRLRLDVDQCALAPTLAALLGLPQPPLADAPPDVRLLALPAGEVQRALDAHVQARLWVARALGAEGVGAIERRRAEVAVTRFGAASESELHRLSVEVDRLLRPQGTALRLGALVLALLGLLAFARCTPEVAHGPGGWGSVAVGVLVLVAGFALPSFGTHGSTAAALLVALALAAALVRAHGARGPGARLMLAALLAVPAAAATGVVLFEASARANAVGLALLALLVGAVAVAAAARARRARRGPRAPAWEPAAVVVLTGAALGLVLSLRSLVDPFFPVQTVVALLACVALAFGWLGSTADARPAWSSALVLPVFGALVLVPFLASASHNPAGWSQSPPWRSDGWALAGLGVVLAAVASLPRPWTGRADRRHVGAAAGALVLAFLGRALDPAGGGAALLARVALAFGPQVLALAAFGLALGGRGTGPGRLAARLVAALALARRLTASDSEFCLVAVLALLCALAAHRRLPAARGGLAGLALLLLLVRTAAFHAAGSVEAFATVDVSRGFHGLEEFVGMGGAALAGESGITWPVVVATIQVSIRFAVPWLLLLAAAAHAADDGPRLRTLVGDVALAFAARGAVLVLALWALADNVWWVERAKDVYALGVGDVLLLLAASAAVGAWRREPRPTPVPVRARPAVASAVA
jgi:hypothetical protein